MVELADAKQRAQQAGLDLVEVAPQAKPPVCRIMDYGKWKYQQRKKEQKARSHAKQSELKEVRLRPKIGDHDLQIKLERAKDFLGAGDKVQFTMLFRGREMAHRELALGMMRKVAEGLAEISKVESPPRQMGRRATMVLSPERKTPSGSNKSADKPAAKPADKTSDQVSGEVGSQPQSTPHDQPATEASS